MPQSHTYMLRIWCSRAVSGEQWVARLDRFPEGESRRFRDPETLLAHLRTVLWATASAGRSPDMPAEPGGSAREPES